MSREGVVYFIHGDHLGSTSLTTDQNGAVFAETRYLPFGEERWTGGTQPTDFTFTGQRADSYIKLMEMGARWYDPQIGRWISPDSIIPDPGNPQSLNRYSYVYNRPLAYIDEDGHFPIIPVLLVLGGVALLSTGSNPLPPDQRPPDWQGLLGLFLLFGGGAAAAVPELAGAGATAACADGDCTNEAQVADKALNTACGDGDCTNEVEAAGQITQQGLDALSRASESGLQPYNALRRAVSGIGLRVHQIVEQ